MPWDSDKSTAADPDNPNADEQLTADEWDAHVTEGHFPADELNFGVNGSGDPVITDPQNADAVVARYDRSVGSWVVDALTTEALSNTAISKGSTTTVYSGTESDSNGGFGISNQPTDGVSTSAKKILSPGLGRRLVVTVSGDLDPGTSRFVDVVSYMTNVGAINVINSFGTNSPAGRSYSKASDGSLELAMASDTYDVVATSIENRRDINA